MALCISGTKSKISFEVIAPMTKIRLLTATPLGILIVYRDRKN